MCYIHRCVWDPPFGWWGALVTPRTHHCWSSTTSNQHTISTNPKIGVSRASKLGPVERWWTQDGKLGITIQGPPPESGRRTYLSYFTYSYCILSRVWKLATLLLVLRHYEHLFLFSMLLLHVTSSRFCLYLLNIYHFTYTFSHAHTEAHTHKHTCTISTQEEWR